MGKRTTPVGEPGHVDAIRAVLYVGPMDIDSADVILVAVDLSAASQEAFATGRRIARARPHATMHLVHVLSGELELAFADDRLAQWARQLPRSALEGIAYESHTLRGDSPAAAIVGKAAELDADLIVIGTAGRRGLGHWVLGSVAEEVVRTAGCAVLVARAKAHVHG